MNEKGKELKYSNKEMSLCKQLKTKKIYIYSRHNIKTG